MLAHSVSSAPDESLSAPAFLAKGTGQLQLAPILANYEFDFEKSPQAGPIVKGSGAVLVEYRETTIQRNGISHSEWEETRRLALGPFEMQILRFYPGAQLMVNHTESRWGTFAIAGGFLVHPELLGEVNAKSDSSSGGHPSRGYTWIPIGSLHEKAWISNVRAAGGFDLLVEYMTIRLRTADAQLDLEANAKSLVPTEGAVRVTERTFYELKVELGAMETSNTPLRTNLWSWTLVSAFTGRLGAIEDPGSIKIPATPSEFPDPVDVLLDGDYELRLAPDPSRPEAALLRFAGEPTRIEEQSRDVLVPDGSGLPIRWSLVSLAGMIAAAGTAYGFHGHRMGRRVDVRPAPIQVVAPAAPPAKESPVTALAALERTYRQDPGNVAAALELGLAYAQKARYAEALPLLDLSIRAFPKADAPRYFGALAFLHLGRVNEGLRHLQYAFRLNPLNVARFLKEGPVHRVGAYPEVRALLEKWSHYYREANSRGYV